MLKKRKHYASKKEAAANLLFDGFIAIFFILYVGSILYILWQTVLTSISSEIENMSVTVRFWTENPTLVAYSEIWKKGGLGRAFLNNVIITVLGTFFHVVICTMAGYALSKPNYPFKQTALTVILISMLVPAQMTMVPTFTLYRSLGLINKMSALVVSGLVSGFSIIVMRNYFTGIPHALWEAAHLDGAGEFKIFWKIYIPLAKPGFVTIITLQLVNKWNTFFDAVLFINDSKKYPLQVALNNIIQSISNAAKVGNAASAITYGQNVKSAAIVIAMLPILILYPFLQKYLVQGMLVGAVKE